MKVGLIIGHKQDSPGACNQKHGVCEYTFNEQLAVDIYDKMKAEHPGIRVQIIKRTSYSALPGSVNYYNPDFCISLHCNAINGKVNGTEVLYYHKSDNSQKLARILQDELLAAFGFKDRGILPRTVEDRGGHLLKHTVMPCVIAEPFFIDNDEAYESVINNYEKLVDAYVNAIVKYSKE